MSVRAPFVRFYSVMPSGWEDSRASWTSTWDRHPSLCQEQWVGTKWQGVVQGFFVPQIFPSLLGKLRKDTHRSTQRNVSIPDEVVYLVFIPHISSLPIQLYEIYYVCVMTVDPRMYMLLCVHKIYNPV